LVDGSIFLRLLRAVFSLLGREIEFRGPPKHVKKTIIIRRIRRR